jgi:MOSC domain-containing protein YiiM
MPATPGRPGGVKLVGRTDRAMTDDGSAHGIVAGLFRKAETGAERGLPKRGVEAIEVVSEGVVGDFNRYRHEELHDDPDSALLIFPEETLAQLAREGWPVKAGDLGENVSSRGIPYPRFRSGAPLSLGTVRADITRPCDPCTNLYLLPYVGQDRGPAFLKTMKNRRGWYARVVVAGRIRRGDPIRFG